MSKTNTFTIESVKRDAKRISRATSVSHSQALDVLAVQAGYTHWGAYQNVLESMVQACVRRTNDGVRPSDLVVSLMAKLAPDVTGVQAATKGGRHMLVSGSAWTGKTSLLLRLMREAPRSAGVVFVEEEAGMPKGDFGYRTVSVAKGPFGTTPVHWEEAYSKALSESPDLVFISEINVHNALLISEAMNDPGSPTLVTTIHAESPAGASARMASLTGRDPAPERRDILCLQIDRDGSGRRVITDITCI